GRCGGHTERVEAVSMAVLVDWRSGFGNITQLVARRSYETQPLMPDGSIRHGHIRAPRCGSGPKPGPAPRAKLCPALARHRRARRDHAPVRGAWVVAVLEPDQRTSSSDRYPSADGPYPSHHWWLGLCRRSIARGGAVVGRTVAQDLRWLRQRLSVAAAPANVWEFSARRCVCSIRPVRRVTASPGRSLSPAAVR